jgi:hypothetical protein
MTVWLSWQFLQAVMECFCEQHLAQNASSLRDTPSLRPVISGSIALLLLNRFLLPRQRQQMVPAMPAQPACFLPSPMGQALFGVSNAPLFPQKKFEPTGYVTAGDVYSAPFNLAPAANNGIPTGFQSQWFV